MNVLGQSFSKCMLYGIPGESIKYKHLNTSPESLIQNVGVRARKCCILILK